MAKEISIEKKARALCASIRLKDQYYGERIETALAKHYGVKEYVVSSLMLEEFLKDQYWKVKELQVRRMEYEQLSPQERTYEDRPMSVRDYFDVPTQYHFYKYIQTVGLAFNSIKKQRELNAESDKVIKKQTVPFINKGKDFDCLSDLLEYAYNSYENLDRMQNMFFTRRDVYLNIHAKSMGSYKSLRKLARDVAIDSGEHVEVAFDNLKKSYESDVFDFMIDYVCGYKNITNEQIEQLKASKQSSDYLGFSIQPGYQYVSLRNDSKKQSDGPKKDVQLTIQEYIEETKREEEQRKSVSVDIEKGQGYGLKDDEKLEIDKFEDQFLESESDNLVWVGDYQDDDLMDNN